jgi:hypothetical protein
VRLSFFTKAVHDFKASRRSSSGSSLSSCASISARLMAELIYSGWPEMQAGQITKSKIEILKTESSPVKYQY